METKKVRNNFITLFLAIFLIIFIAGFISKQEQKIEKTNDEILFKTYLNGFPQAIFPLKIKANNNSFNEKNKVPRKFYMFFPHQQERSISGGGAVNTTYEYLYKVVENEEIVVVVCGSRSNFSEKENIYQKLFIYSKKGKLLLAKTLAYEAGNTAFTTNINADLTFYRKEFTLKHKKKQEWILKEIKNFMITPAGEIINTDKK